MGVLIGSIIIVAILVVLIKYTCDNHQIKDAIGAELINVEPIIKQDARPTGYTVGYTSRGTVTAHNHYKYEDVVVGYRHTYRVTYKDGSVREVGCLKGDRVYKALSRFERKIPL